jgi:hypothetical protein
MLMDATDQALHVLLIVVQAHMVNGFNMAAGKKKLPLMERQSLMVGMSLLLSNNGIANKNLKHCIFNCRSRSSNVINVC